MPGKDRIWQAMRYRRYCLLQTEKFHDAIVVTPEVHRPESVLVIRSIHRRLCNVADYVKHRITLFFFVLCCSLRSAGMGPSTESGFCGARMRLERQKLAHDCRTTCGC